MDEQTLNKYKDHIVDPRTQQNLNQPLQDVTGFNEGHEAFLNMLIGKIESDEINPHKIETLQNKPPVTVECEGYDKPVGVAETLSRLMYG